MNKINKLRTIALLMLVPGIANAVPVSDFIDTFFIGGGVMLFIAGVIMFLVPGLFKTGVLTTLIADFLFVFRMLFPDIIDDTINSRQDWVDFINIIPEGTARTYAFVAAAIVIVVMVGLHWFIRSYIFPKPAKYKKNQAAAKNKQKTATQARRREQPVYDDGDEADFAPRSTQNYQEPEDYRTPEPELVPEPVPVPRRVAATSRRPDVPQQPAPMPRRETADPFDTPVAQQAPIQRPATPPSRPQPIAPVSMTSLDHEHESPAPAYQSAAPQRPVEPARPTQPSWAADAARHIASLPESQERTPVQEPISPTAQQRPQPPVRPRPANNAWEEESSGTYQRPVARPPVQNTSRDFTNATEQRPSAPNRHEPVEPTIGQGAFEVPMVDDDDDFGYRRNSHKTRQAASSPKPEPKKLPEDEDIPNIPFGRIER